ncbi:hypothetical protein [Protaetiibacter mangrovi]|uniref:Alpha/beta hydrolase n=1 Tax=Protaetiibacter mangrovi TaxID=2970926 RepID=A0ABT1ZH71_9MICO|nr:hypothetical protein [Protaetiibacter mangrovi]MCS0500049.1 hypothetical protein [Protaetiibacter mangrovi]
MRSDDPAPGAPASVTPASPLVVHSGRSTLVATDALLAHLSRLAALADEVEADGHRLALLALDCPPGTLRGSVDRCRGAALSLAEELRALRRSVALAEEVYDAGERMATWMQDAAAEWLTGALSRAVLSLLPGAVLGGVIAWNMAPGTAAQKKAAVQRWMLDHPRLITSPGFSEVVRRVVTGADDAALGAAGAPPWLPVVLGEHGLGILGVDTSAAVIVAAGGLSGTRVFHETPVRVERIAQHSTAMAPSGAEQRLARVPDDEQVRIERYSAPGEADRFVVYVAPTQTFSPVADEEAWDLTSNVAGVAGLPAGSIRATEQAMADAGITADSEIVLVGFSQGGLVADAIAASGDWNAVGLETYGDPGGGIALPEGVRGVAVRHSDDFVVATGGPQGATDRTIVERRAYPEGSTIPTDLPAPAHQRRAYAETARLLDAARSPELRGELDAIDAFTHDYASRAGSEITTFGYRAERLPAEVSASSSAGGR